MDTTGNIPFYPSIVSPEIINKVENDYIRLEPKVKEIGELADSWRGDSDNINKIDDSKKVVTIDTFNPRKSLKTSKNNKK
jgi:hypothetical protein